MTSPIKKVGFVGVGHMGTPMASCLHRAGFELWLMDANASAASGLASSLGSPARAVANGTELGQNCDLIITMLPTSAIVREVLLGSGGVLAAARAGTWFLDMTSGVPDQTQEIAKFVSAAGCALLDAPVSGGVARARTGDLAIMVGGETDQVEAVRPVLEAMGSHILRTGGTGSGHAMKALNNLVSAGGFLISVEAMMIGQRFGLDPGVMVDVLNASSGSNNSTQKKCKQFVLSRGFDSGFGLDLMVKDLTIALGIANHEHTPAPFSSLCRELWASTAAILGPGQDHTAISKLVETLTHTRLESACVPPKVQDRAP